MKKNHTITHTNNSKTSDRKPLISLILPAYNEDSILEKNLNILDHYMHSLKHEYRWEMIIVNDGSTDKTPEIAEKFAQGKNNVYVLHHKHNFRLGQALRFAFNNCEGDYAIVMDIDLTYSKEHIKRMLDKIEESHAKIVIASPYMAGGKISNIPWIRKFFSIWANRFLSMFTTRDPFSDKIKTLTGMVRAYDGDFLRNLSLRAMDMDIHSEIIYKAMILRAKIVEIPAHLDWGSLKKVGTRRASSMKMIKGIISNLLSGFMLRPFMFFIIPSLIIFLLSLYPLTWSFIHTYDYYHKVPESVESFNDRLSAAILETFKQSPHGVVVGGISLMVAIQLFSLGMQVFQSKRYFEELFHLGSNQEYIIRKR